jgi:hypothetical protein
MRLFTCYLVCVFIFLACESEENSNNNQDLSLGTYLPQNINMPQAGDTTSQLDQRPHNQSHDMYQRDQGGGETIDLMIVDIAYNDMGSSVISENDMNIFNDMSLHVDLGEDIPPADIDTDGDGLMDRWEWSAQNRDAFDWEKSDTDGDGILDGDEDEDEDQLPASLEQWLSLYSQENSDQVVEDQSFNPLVFDMLVEIDSMQDSRFEIDALSLVIDAFASIRGMNLISHGIILHIYLDESIPSTMVPGNLEQRQNLLVQHSATNFPEEFPKNRMIHVISATQRSDQNFRAGEVVGHPEDIEKSGVLIYQDYISSIHPRCGFDDPIDPVPFITVIEAQAGTLIHELGHVLQLGHDSAIEGLNPWNVMSVLEGCVSTRQRFHGEGNDDPSLGSSSMIFASRFSQQAVDLMRVDLLLSVDIAELVREGQGFEH